MSDLTKIEQGGKDYAETLGFGHNSMDTKTWHNRLSNAFQNGAKSDESKEHWIEKLTENPHWVMNNCCDSVGYVDVVSDVFKWLEKNNYKIIKDEV